MSMKDQLLSVLAALLALGAADEARAQQLAMIDSADATEVAPITVIATRSAQRTDEVPATVTVITAEDIDALLATDIKDLVQFEPGVSVPTSPARFNAALTGEGRDGNAGFTIRGLGGDRVLMITDGVRIPDGFSFGAQAVGRGGYNDLDLIQSVEILRGPASALYGSDGVAGAISFTTRDPVDFLEPGRGFGGRARVAYGSADESWTEGLSLAARRGDWSALLAYTRRDFTETENQGVVGGEGPSRTRPNPQDFRSNALLGKLVWDPDPAHRLRLTWDHYDMDMAGDALSSRGPAVPPFQPNAVLQVLATDETRRDRISLDHEFTGVLGLQDGAWSLYWQQSTTRQFTFEDRAPAADRTRDVTFDNRVVGLAFQGRRDLRLGGAEHRLTFGGDASLTRQEAIRDGAVPPAGETFPHRPFPSTDYTLAGVFIQDEIRLLDGRLSLIPALRFDWYDLSAEQDALYTAPIAGQSDHHLSPKLGAIWWADDHFGLFANYAVGFKAPSPMQVNNAFSNPLFGYVSAPNPDLRPETSESFEAGIRFRDLDIFGGRAALSATAFRADYEDFISQIAVSGSFTPADPAVFQYVNLGQVEIWGLEARGSVDWSNGFRLDLSAAFADGEQSDGGVKAPLPSIDPIKLVAGLAYSSPDRRWGGQTVITWSDARDRGDTVALACAPDCYPGEAFTLLDLTAWWNLTDRAVLRAGAFNLTDETYAWWSDVRGVAASSTVLDAYTQPGRNFRVSLAYRF